MGIIELYITIVCSAVLTIPLAFFILPTQGRTDTPQMLLVGCVSKELKWGFNVNVEQTCLNADSSRRRGNCVPERVSTAESTVLASDSTVTQLILHPLLTVCKHALTRFLRKGIFVTTKRHDRKKNAKHFDSNIKSS